MNVLGVHGSRTLKDERVRIILLEEIEKHRPDYVVTHAEPEGVCEVARQLCRDKAMPLKLHFLNFRFLRGAFEHRSKDVLKEATHSIFIHDGKSRGTANEMVLCKKMGLPMTVHELKQTPYNASVGFEIEQEWDMEEIDLPTIEVPL